MPSTMPYRQGDIVLVSFPFTDLSSSKRRPALVLSPDSFNAAGEDLVLAAVTSQITDDPNAVPLWQGHFAEGGLPKPSMVKPTKLFTMHSSLIAKRIGALRIEKMEEILRSLRRFFS
ncbi:MAG: type II toxin-antitoxin system PemK/MazF family toxin [Gemmatimonadetes bacterium]|nr:type II toxin-antitoxin system PemK/MazF family toxin [Gemmatimonadota bacterium]MYB97691.1 type II toxin-antitoxin system PemK/MazF family toxin [Gemmatimonadota bacterium]